MIPPVARPMPSQKREYEGPCVSVILPTFNRAAALHTTIPCLLAMEHIGEVIVVVDGSTDETMSVLAGFADERLRIFRYANAGSPTARNRGAGFARYPWLLLADDDDWYPPDYATKLLEVAYETRADIVGAPWVNAAGGNETEIVAKHQREPQNAFGFDTHPSTFPDAEIETPFIPAPALVRSTVYSRITFDHLYRGNAWREETSFFLSAIEAGFRVVLTPRTFTVHRQDRSGGQKRNAFAYEYWVIRNNWRFLFKHRHWLRNNGHIRNPFFAHVAFISERLGMRIWRWSATRIQRQISKVREHA